MAKGKLKARCRRPANSSRAATREPVDRTGSTLPLAVDEAQSRLGPQLPFVIQACAGAKILGQVITPEKPGRLARSSLEPAPI